MSTGDPIRVLVVDDSALVRRTVSDLINADPELAVAGVAVDGQDALDKVGQLQPDVVSLDLNMPVMDGMTCLHHLVRDRQRVVILSTLARESSFATFRALALGAIDFVTKPGEGLYLSGLDEVGRELRAKIRIAAAIPREQIGRRHRLAADEEPIPRHPEVVQIAERLRAITGIGGSTGGTVALESILRRIPAFLPVSLVIVQHIPSGFSRHFAHYLDTISHFSVVEASDRTPIQPHCAYLAPGGVHTRVQATAAGLVLRLDAQAPQQRGFKPSIDLLLYSLANACHHQAVGILLSGMGGDGVSGLGAIHRLGGRTLVQDRDSSVVFDMPARALAAGVVDQVLPPALLAATIYPPQARDCGEEDPVAPADVSNDAPQEVQRSRSAPLDPGEARRPGAGPARQPAGQGRPR